MKSINFCVAILVATFGVSGCGMINNLEEMHDSTQDMSKTTKDMAETTSGMAVTTEAMADTTSGMAVTTEGMAITTQEMAATTSGMAITTEDMATTTEIMERTTDQTYRDLRQGSSSDIRRQALHKLEESDSMELKLAEAAHYFDAFEFQLWSLDTHDSEEERQILFKVAAAEFLRTLNEYAGPVEDRSTSPSSNNNDRKSMYALATASHYLNPNQEAAAAERGFEATSMKMLLERGLAERAAVESGEKEIASLAPFQVEVLKRDQDAIHVFRVRANFLAAMTLAGMSRIDEKGFLGIPGLLRKLKMLYFPWQLQDDDQNQVELIENLTKYMDSAGIAKAFLESIGEDPMIDKRVLRILKHARFDLEDADSEARNAAEAALQAEVLEFLGPDAPKADLEVVDNTH